MTRVFKGTSERKIVHENSIPFLISEILIKTTMEYNFITVYWIKSGGLEMSNAGI